MLPHTRCNGCSWNCCFRTLMKTPLRYLALLFLLSLAFAGTPGHATAMAVMDQPAACATHGGMSHCQDKNQKAERCAAHCAAASISNVISAPLLWQPAAPRVLAIADRPHTGWQLEPRTPPPRPIS